MKYFTNSLIAFFIAVMLTSSTFADSIDASSVVAISPHEIEVTFSENPNLRVWEVNAEVKVLQDISLRGGFSSSEANSVELILEDPLLPNTYYSLLSIIGADGSIDFKTSEELSGKTIMNLAREGDEDIKSITIRDPRTILIHYVQELTETQFEYKLLAESTVEAIENRAYDDGKIYMSINPPLIAEQNYILMFLDMQDVDGMFLDFESGIYDFSTPPSEEWDTVQWVSTTVISDTLEESLENIDRGVIEDITILPEVLIIEEEVENLQAAGEEISLEKNINEVAQQVSETPDTGAETWVLILLSLVINTIYYLSRKKIQATA